MKITAFLGSPRAGGNTDTLAEYVLKGAREAGYETQSAALRAQKIHPCIGCERCWEKGRPCVFEDDMGLFIEMITESDVLLFATPVYWYAPTTLMKTFIDRFVVFNRPRGRPLIAGKGALLVTAYEEEGPIAAEPLIRMFELSFDYLGLRFLDRIIVDGVGPKGAVLEKPDVLEQAYQTGLNLKNRSSEG